MPSGVIRRVTVWLRKPEQICAACAIRL